MGDNKTYRDYFAIDEKYYASVTAKLIEEGKVSWKQFYPHETFVDLLEKTHVILSGKETRSLWVEGAYGTGKSHAALTVKSLLEASDEEIRAYFDDYGLNKDLGEKLIADKNNGQLIAIHRIGSASIHSDDDLIIAIQESLLAALEQHHIEKRGESSLREAALKWLEKEANKNYFSTLIAEEKYAWEFSGKTIDTVIEGLKSNDKNLCANLMHSLLKVAKDNGILALRLDAQGMADWIRTIIKENNLNAILFIWDEFTEFFQNNRNSLTGFQTLVEVSESAPFYFMIVSHESRSLFATADDAKKILGRFMPPVKIELPENMAFRLMAQAMKRTSDPALAEEWKIYANDLNESLAEARQIITESSRKYGFGEKTHLQSEDLQRIVPIHPYAALLLKHISVVFSSNQRSMFDFIISNDMKSKGFKWYIENFGPLDSKNFLTVDMMWEFFCVQGQSGLTDDVRTILDSYNLVDNDRFNDDEKRVFKTILLLQSLSQRVGNVELLKSNDRNIDLAFAGTEWPQYKAHSIADKMVKDQVLFKRPAGNRTEYIVALNTNDHSEIDKLKEEMRKEKKTKSLVIDAGLPMVLSLPKAYSNRYEVTSVTVEDFTKMTNLMSQQEWNGKFPVMLSFALNEAEGEQIKNLVEQNVKSGKNQELIFIDASLSPMGVDNYDRYVESMAYSRYYAKSDSKQAEGFNRQADDALKAWVSKVQNGSFVLYNKDNLSGLRCANMQVLVDELKKIDRHVYPYGLEQYNVTDSNFAHPKQACSNAWQGNVTY